MGVTSEPGKWVVRGTFPVSPPPGPEDGKYRQWHQWMTYEERTKFYTSDFLERMPSPQETFDPRLGEGLEGCFIT